MWLKEKCNCKTLKCRFCTGHEHCSSTCSKDSVRKKVNLLLHENAQRCRILWLGTSCLSSQLLSQLHLPWPSMLLGSSNMPLALCLVYPMSLHTVSDEETQWMSLGVYPTEAAVQRVSSAPQCTMGNPYHWIPWKERSYFLALHNLVKKSHCD